MIEWQYNKDTCAYHASGNGWKAEVSTNIIFHYFKVQFDNGRSILGSAASIEEAKALAFDVLDETMGGEIECLA